MGGSLEEFVIGAVLIDGELSPTTDASLSILDIGLLRGYGCFEALRSYEGRPFRSASHVDRLRASADRLDIALPDDDVLGEWIADRSSAGGDCVVRIVVTGGVDPLRPGTDTHVVVFAEPIPEMGESLRALPVDAPWHPDGSFSELTGAKTLSYGPNLAASLAAHRAGFDDALLIGRSGTVLEGPTFGVGWVVDGVVETPSLDLGILASITRAAMLEVARDADVPVNEGRFTLERLGAAQEVFALSTVKEIMPISSVGDDEWTAGPVTRTLAAGYSALVGAEPSAA